MLRKIYNHVIDPKIQLLAASAAAAKIGLSVFQIPGNNMASTLEAGEVGWFKPITSKVTLLRGQVVVVSLKEIDNVLVPYRVVGLPGETAQLRQGNLLINDTEVPEPYIDRERAEQNYSIKTKKAHVPSDYVWLLGDFRDLSKDSRHFGSISISSIVGLVINTHSLGDHANPRNVR